MKDGMIELCEEMDRMMETDGMIEQCKKMDGMMRQ